MRQRTRILVTEDDFDLRSAICSMLELLDYEVLQAANGLEAWTCFTSFRPHLIVTDLEMPIMNGAALIERVKALDGDFPVVLITAARITEIFLDLLRYPRILLVRKPFDFEDLELALEKVHLLSPIGSRQARRSVRVPVELKVELGEYGQGVVRNLSEGGAFIESDVLPALSEVLSLTFYFEDKSITTNATVAWRDKKKSGYGVSFEHLSECAVMRLRQLLVCELHKQLSRPLRV